PRYMEGWPDVFNPFLYGPNRYDHELATLLSLLKSGWSDLSAGGSEPPWWTPRIERALRHLSEQTPSDAESKLVEVVEGRIPNRLHTPLTKPVPELARELIALAD